MAALFAGPTLLFLIFAFGALSTALMVVLNPNPVRSALYLVLNLFCVAVLYLLLNAYFLAAVQVIVYAGAIMVLFLFVIMLLNLGAPDRTADRLKGQSVGALLASIGLVALISFTALRSVPDIPQDYLAVKDAERTAAQPPASPTPAATNAPETGVAVDAQLASVQEVPETGDSMGTVEGIGRTLYNPGKPWLFPFEVTSVLLLIAVVGSVVLARRAAPEELDTQAEMMDSFDDDISGESGGAL